MDSIDKAERKTGRLVYWESGYPRMETMHAREKASAELGFYFQHVWGCVVNEKVVSKIKRHNKRVDRQLSKKIGSNWRELVGRKEDSIFHADTLLINNFYQTELYNKWITALPEPLQYFEFTVYPAKERNVVIIKAEVMDDFPLRPMKSLITVRATYPGLTYEIIEPEKDTNNSNYPGHLD